MVIRIRVLLDFDYLGRWRRVDVGFGNLGLDPSTYES